VASERGRLRVFHLIKSLGRGGAEVLLVETLRCADRDAFELAYGYFLPWKDALVGELEAEGAEVTCFRAASRARILSKVRAVARHLRAWEADVVHCHLPLAGVVGRMAGWLAGVPVVYTEHNLQERYHGLTRRTNRATWRLQRHVVAVSEDVAASARRACGTAVPITVVRNGVAVERFRRDPGAGARVRAELGIAPETVVLGTVAVFRVQKRLDRWLEAAARIRAAVSGAKFVFVGDGPLRGEVEGWIRARGLQGAVHLVGLQDDVRPYLAAMDLYLISSSFEGLPVALLEAMAAGLPVVATAVGGIPEVVEPGVSGRLVQDGDVAGLAEAAIALAGAPELRARMGAAGRERVTASFSMARMTRELEGIYRGVVGSARRASVSS